MCMKDSCKCVWKRDLKEKGDGEKDSYVGVYIFFISKYANDFTLI